MAGRTSRNASWDPVAGMACGLSAGIVAADRLDGGAAVAVQTALVVVALALFAAWRLRPRARGILAPLVPIAGAALLGMARASPACDALPVAATAEEPIARVEGTVVQALLPSPAEAAPGPLPRTSTFALESARVTAGGMTLEPRGIVLVRVPAGGRCIPRGAHVRATGTLVPARQARNPGAASAVERRHRHGIAAVLRARTATAVQVVRPAPAWSLAAPLDRARAELRHRLARSLDPPAAALAAALLLGVRDDLDPEQVESFAASGALHLLAISGLHVALVVGGLRALFGLVLAPRPADGAAMLFALAYAGLAGAGSPVLRAALGAAVVLGGRCLGRHPGRFTTVALAACVLLLLDPADLFRPGFQLSFVAVTALIAAPPRRRRSGGRLRRCAAAVLEALAISCRAAIATAPLTLFHFGRVTPLGPVVTVAVGPLFLATFTSMLVHGFVLIWIPGADRLAAPLVERLAAALTAMVTAAAALPGAAVTWPRPTLPVTVLLGGGAALLLARRWRVGCALLLLAAGGDAASRAPPRVPELWLLDVDHGQAALLRLPSGTALMFDCGSRGRPDVGWRTVLPALDAIGVLDLDLVVLSHADADHVNGVRDLLRAGRVDRLAWGERVGGTATAAGVRAEAQRRGVPWRNASRGDVLWEEPDQRLQVDVLAPVFGAPPRSENDDSVVVRITLGSVRVLLPGDVESAGIRALLEDGTAAADVLLLPHHGLPDPLLGPLIHAAAPRLVLASRADAYREDAAMPRLAARQGAHLRTTATSGAIRVRIRTDGEIRADGFLETNAIP